MGSSYRSRHVHLWSLWRPQNRGTCTAVTSATLYQISDRLHAGRTVCVPANGIGLTVSAWSAELGAHSPLVADLKWALHTGDWPTAHAIGEDLSVDVTIAA